MVSVESRGGSRAAAPGCGFSRGTTARSVSLSWGPLPDSWEICIQVKKQQLELDMEQQTGSKSGKEYVKAV